MMAIFTTIVGTMLAAIVGHEAKAWAPKSIQALLSLAIRRTPTDLRPRMNEEWSAHLAEIPGTVGKLVAAAGFVFAAKGLEVRSPMVERFTAILIVVRLAGRVIWKEIRDPSRNLLCKARRVLLSLRLVATIAGSLRPVITGRKPLSYGYNMMDSMTTIMRAFAAVLGEGRDPLEDADLKSLSLNPETGCLNQNPFSTPQ